MPTKNSDMRIPPIAHEQWTSEVREILASFSIPFSQYGLNGDETEKDRLSPILSTVLQNPTLSRVYFPFADYVLRKSSLQPRHTRLLILRVAWLWRFELEWAQHSTLAVRDNILTAEDVQHIKQGADSPHWNAVETLLVSAVDEMREHSMIADATWQALCAHLGMQQMTDVVFTIGSYVLAGMYMNCFKLPIPPTLTGFTP